MAASFVLAAVAAMADGEVTQIRERTIVGQSFLAADMRDILEPSTGERHPIGGLTLMILLDMLDSTTGTARMARIHFQKNAFDRINVTVIVL